MTYDEATKYLKQNWKDVPDTLQAKCAFYKNIKEKIIEWAGKVKSDLPEVERKRYENWIIMAARDLQESPEGWNKPQQKANDFSIYPLKDENSKTNHQ